MSSLCKAVRAEWRNAQDTRADDARAYLAGVLAGYEVAQLQVETMQVNDTFTMYVFTDTINQN